MKDTENTWYNIQIFNNSSNSIYYGKCPQSKVCWTDSPITNNPIPLNLVVLNAGSNVKVSIGHTDSVQGCSSKSSKITFSFSGSPPTYPSYCRCALGWYPPNFKIPRGMKTVDIGDGNLAGVKIYGTPSTPVFSTSINEETGDIEIDITIADS